MEEGKYYKYKDDIETNIIFNEITEEKYIEQWQHYKTQKLNGAKMYYLFDTIDMDEFDQQNLEEITEIQYKYINNRLVEVKTKNKQEKPGRPSGTTMPEEEKKVYYHMYVRKDQPEKIKAIGGAKIVRQLIDEYYNKMFSDNATVK